MQEMPWESNIVPNSEDKSGDSAELLKTLRAEIDAVDEALHDLLMRRTELAQHMGALKANGGTDSRGTAKGQNPIRPAREAAILRRLAARHSGALPFDVVVQVWRELIGANLRHQCDFELAVLEANESRLWDMARASFGGLTRATGYMRAKDAIGAVSRSPGTLAVLPAPATAPPEVQMWPELLAAEGAPRILCTLPPLKGESWPEAFIVGHAPGEPSGEDFSFVLLTGRTPPGPQANDLAGAGLEGRILAIWPGMSILGHHCAFAAVRGFLRPDDAALERLHGRRRADGGAAILIGTAPTPIRPPDG